MPEVDIQRRTGPAVPVWVWVIVALLVIGLIWWLIAQAGDRPEVAEVPGTERVAGATEEVPAEHGYAALALSAWQKTPDRFFGQEIGGTAEVVEVVSERVFWVKEADTPARMLVFKEEPMGATPVLNPGQRVYIKGTIADPRRMEEMPDMAAVPEETRNMLTTQPAFIKSREVTIVETAAPGEMAPGQTETQGETGTQNP